MVYDRIRAVCAHEPESEFAFVGTKLDLVGHSDECVQRVGGDVLARCRRRDADEIRSLDRILFSLKQGEAGQDGDASEAVQAKVTRLEALRHQRPKILTQTFVAMSSANAKGLSDVRKELQHCIISGGSAFLMPADYTNVKDFLGEIVREAKQAKALTAQVNAVFVHPDDLIKKIVAHPEFSQLNANDVTSMLRVFHVLGIILWFDKSSGALSDVVFLSPDLVIDFVRKMINHELGERRPGCFMWLGSPRGLSVIEKAVKKEGRVAHKLLTSLALWRDVTDDKLMLQLKELMFHFQLAYPAGAKRLQYDSDLIVPVYWKKSGNANSIPKPPQGMFVVATWDYDFQNGFPASLFDRLGVVSYSANYSHNRFFSRDAFGTQTAEYWATVAKHSNEECDGTTAGASTLRIHIVATSPLTAWKQLKWYVMSVERVLDEYLGLWVIRYAVSNDKQRYELDQLVEEQQARMAMDMADDASTGELLPPWMEWFTMRAWEHVGRKRGRTTTSSAATESVSCESSLNAFEKVMERIDDVKREFESVHKHLDQVQDTAITLSAAEGNRRDYPVLWTLAYRECATTSRYELELRSELSGECFHELMCITVPNEFFRKYDVVIKAGLSVMCAVIPDMLGKGVIEYLASAAGDQIDRGVAVHSLRPYQRLAMDENRTLSPDATVALLRDLLKIVDDSFDPLKMSAISGLECGIYHKAVGQRKKGEHVWAHRQEIEARRDAIRFRHEYHGDIVSEDAVIVDETVGTSPDTLDSVSAIVDAEGNGAGSVDEISPNEKSQGVREGPVAVVVPIEEGKEARNTVLPSLAVPKAATPVSAESSSLEIVVEIVKATNLPDVRLVGTQSPLCQWKLLDPSGASIAAGQTHAHVRGGRDPNWSGQHFRVSTAVKTLKGCVFVAAVKTETAIGGMMEVIAEGTYHLSEGALASGTPSEFGVVLLSKGEPAGSLTFRLHT